MRRNLIIGIALTCLGCGSKAKKEDPQPDNTPAKVSLLTPRQNEVCAEGEILSATESNVSLDWSDASNADQYEVTITNLETKAVQTATTTTSATKVTLARGVPFSWSVRSKASRTGKTAESETWKFYNPAAGLTQYAPFPATLSSPAQGETIITQNGKLTLSWIGADADNDIDHYELYFGGQKEPLLLQNLPVNNTTAVISVNSGSIYYWSITTIDKQGNRTPSTTQSFKVK